jgi:hypothetical protein
VHRQTSLFTAEENHLLDQILDYLEKIRWQHEQPPHDDVLPESIREALILNLAKVANDCRAILLLAQSGFYIQAGILARSTTDACNLLLHISVAEDDAALVDPWLTGAKVTHWMLLEEINEGLERDLRLDTGSYRETRRRLDDLVHANYEALKLYPAQLSETSLADEATFHSLTFWKNLVYFFLIACLLAALLIAPDLEGQAEGYLNRILALVHGSVA